MKTNSGETVAELSSNHQVLLIFLRHLACIFCREALKDIKKIKEQLDKFNTEIVFVHMTDNETANEIFENYKLPEVKHISDISKELYKSFGLYKGDFRQLFGFKSFIGMGRASLKGNLPSSNPIGDPQQMPGVFVINNEKVTNYFIYNSVGDYPNYMDLIKNMKNKELSIYFSR